MGAVCGKSEAVDMVPEMRPEKPRSSPSPFNPNDSNRQYYATVKFNSQKKRFSHFGTVRNSLQDKSSHPFQAPWLRDTKQVQDGTIRVNNQLQKQEKAKQDLEAWRRRSSSSSRFHQVSSSASQNLSDLHSMSLEDHSPISHSSARVRGFVASERISAYGTFSLRTQQFREFFIAPRMFSKYAKYQYLVDSQMSQPHLEKLLRAEVKTPKSENPVLWQMKNTIHLYETIRVFYYRIARICTVSSCPTMNAGRQYTFKWQHEEGVISTESAPEYMDLLFDWVENMIADTSIFPYNGTVPVDTKSTLRTILRRLFRVYAHLFCAHFDKIDSMGLKSDLNIRFQHFCYFVLTHQLIHQKELLPLKPLIQRIIPSQLLSP